MPTDHTIFVGREDELECLASLLIDARMGRGKLVVIRGEAGIGKTSLIRTLLAEVSRLDIVTCEGRWYENMGVRPYNGFLEAMESRGKEELSAAVKRLGALSRPLKLLLPDLHGSRGRQSGAVASQLQVYEAVARTFLELAPGRTLCLALDDLQHAERESLSLLEYFVRRTSGAGISIIAAVRHTDVDGDHPLRSVLAALRHDGLVTELDLHGLPSGRVHELLERLAAMPVSAKFAQAVHKETAGNPLFVIELLRALEDQGLLASAASGPARAIRPAQLKVSEGLRELIRARLRRLGRPAADVLEAGAVLGARFRFAALRAVAGLGDDELSHCVDTGIDAGILAWVSEENRAMLVFTHPLIREGLYQQLGETRRRVMHSRVAEALVMLQNARSESYAGEVAYHMVQAGDFANPKETLRWCAEAGIGAVHLCSYQDALTHLGNARAYYARVGGDERLLASVLTETGFAHGQFGRVQESLDYYDQARRIYERLGDDRMVAKLNEKTGSMMNTYGQFEEARVALEKALTGMEGEISGDHCAALAAYSIALMSSGHLNEAGPYIQQCLEIAARVEHPGYRALAEHAAAIFDVWDFGEPEKAPASFRRSFKLAIQAGSLDGGARTNADAALSLYIFGKTEEARSALDTAEEFAQKYHRGILGDVWATRTLVAVHRGDWGLADDGWAKYHQIAGEATATAFDAVARRARALRLYWSGDIEGALDIVSNSPPLFNAPLRAWLLLELGREQEAVPLLEVIRSKLPIDGRGGLWLLFALPTLSAFRQLGGVQDAEKWVGSLNRFRTWQTDWFIPGIELGWLAAAAGMHPEARRYFSHAIDFCRARGELPFEAIARYELARYLLSRSPRGEKSQAIALLKECLDAFSALQMKPNVNRTESALREACTGRPPSDHPFGLTERELQVLAMLADGLSNLEISRDLKLSRKTVERHVSSILAKMDASDRTQAAVRAVRENLVGPISQVHRPQSR